MYVCMYVDENGLWILATVLTASSVNPIGMIAAVVLFTAVVAYISINQPQLSLPRRKIASSKTKTIEFPKPEPRPLPLKGESVDPPPPPPQQQPDCRNRHPNWPECPTGRNKEPYSVAHEFLQNHCKSKSGDVVTKSCFPITEIKPACGVGGGIQYHCTLQDSCGELPSEYRVSVRCCNCCSGPLGKSTESCSCSNPHYSQGKVPPQCLSSATT